VPVLTLQIITELLLLLLLDQQMGTIMYPPPVAGSDDAASAAAEEEYDATDAISERMAVDTPRQQRTVIQPSTTATGRDTPASLESSDDDNDDGNSADGSPNGGAAATSASTAAAVVVAAATTAAATSTTTSTTTTGKKRRGRPSLGGTKTACSAKGAKKKKVMQDKSKRCQKGARVKVTRANLYHVLIDDDQRKAIEKEGQSVNLHGTILSGTKATGYKICFNDLPDGKKDVIVRRRAIIVVLQPGEEEKAHDHEQAEEVEEVRDDRCNVSEKLSSIEFSNLDPVVQAGAKEFVMNVSEKWIVLVNN
jgi:hypothetical protein